eukprot:scaffold79245_cov47-Phaeocystis_antarctica.AAC.2
MPRPGRHPRPARRKACTHWRPAPGEGVRVRVRVLAPSTPRSHSWRARSSHSCRTNGQGGRRLHAARRRWGGRRRSSGPMRWSRPRALARRRGCRASAAPRRATAD